MSATDATPASEPRALRADARRNRERLLAAACAAFAEHGFEVGVAEIARRAGVGTGTLFRHFPCKLDLEVAVVLTRAERLRAVLADALAEPDAWDAFERALTRMVELTACDRCISEASPEVMADPRVNALRDGLLADIGRLLTRGRAAGVVRPDIQPEDVVVLTTTVAATVQRFRGTDRTLWRRYLGIVLDGLRAAGAAPLTPGPPDLGALERSRPRPAAARPAPAG